MGLGGYNWEFAEVGDISEAERFGLAVGPCGGEKRLS